jgi:ABC-type methionine transport system ATPase subunit
MTSGIKEPSILLLDEITSAMDVKSELKVLGVINAIIYCSI